MHKRFKIESFIEMTDLNDITSPLCPHHASGVSEYQEIQKTSKGSRQQSKSILTLSNTKEPEERKDGGTMKVLKAQALTEGVCFIRILQKKNLTHHRLLLV